MNRTIAGLALLAFGLTLNAQEQIEQLEIRRATVVTVHAKACPEKSAEPCKPGKLKRAGSKALAGAGNTVGWLLNVNDDIPSARERALKNRSRATDQTLRN